jgi:hypothetical protein
MKKRLRSFASMERYILQQYEHILRHENAKDAYKLFKEQSKRLCKQEGFSVEEGGDERTWFVGFMTKCGSNGGVKTQTKNRRLKTEPLLPGIFPE